MNLSPASSGPAALITEPPLSPGPAPSPPPVSIPPSLEAQVVRIGLMTPGDVATTIEEQAETGRPFAELAVENGRVDADDLAKLIEPNEAPPVEPELEPGDEAVLEPDAASDSGPEVREPEAPATAEVYVRLTNGERIEAGSYEGEEAAESRAKELMQALDARGDWPSIGGRFIRPDAVVSIDVDLATA